MTCSWAAYQGNLELLQWIRSQGCPWDIWTCIFAARMGHLDVLEWAIVEGCPWDSRVKKCVIEKGNGGVWDRIMRKLREKLASVIIHVIS